jgi:2-hydroxy-3-oxopropionate reductase
MGTPMASHLLSAGHELSAYTRGDFPESLLALGAVKRSSAREVAEASSVTFIMVPDTPHVEDVLFAPDGICAATLTGKTIVDMSSISPLETKTFAARVSARGADYLDAPVSGGEVGAKAATLTIMVGGEEIAFARVKPLFEVMGKNITHVGASGAGQTCKVANQIIVALTIEAVGEALIFAAKAGADPARVRTALMGGFAASRILEVHGERMINRSFTPGFRIELHQKDLRLALDGARALGVSLPHTASVAQMMNACVANGGADWDHSALVKSLEMASHYSLDRSSN